MNNEKSLGLSMIQEHVKNCLDSPPECPFGYDGVMFYVKKFDENLYSMRWYTDTGKNMNQSFSNLDEIFDFVELGEYIVDKKHV